MPNGYILDRREQHRDKSHTGGDRFIRRHKEIIKQAAADTIRRAKGFTDLTDRGEHSISIDRKSLDEPQFQHGPGGEQEFILSNNDIFTVGDTLPRPDGGAGQGGHDGSPDGEGDDSFTFYLNRDEFLRLILDDLALPDLVKKNVAYSIVEELVHPGFIRTGSPGNMDVQRSYKMSLCRRVSLRRREKKDGLAELEAELINRTRAARPMAAAITEGLSRTRDAESPQQLLDSDNELLKAEIAVLRAKLRAIPFFDPNVDLRYRHRELGRTTRTFRWSSFVTRARHKRSMRRHSSTTRRPEEPLSRLLSNSSIGSSASGTIRPSGTSTSPRSATATTMSSTRPGVRTSSKRSCCR
jgi:uncharacterized sporulation protein YeaH/YhbH (DUF444 family)